MKRVLITGGAGFIGSNIALELADRFEVVVFDNLSTGDEANLADVMKKVEFISGDIREIGSVKKAVRGVDYVLHQAALPSVVRSVNDPSATSGVNVEGTLNVLLAARDEGVGRVVYASSSSVYGDQPAVLKNEKMKPNPLSPYAVSKLAAEHYCRVFYKIYGLETVALRYFNVFGPRQSPNSQYAAAIPKFISAMRKGERPVIFGDGKQSRDFTYVGDVVRANLLALKARRAPGEVFNIACGRRTTLNALIEKINGLLGTEIKPRYEKPRAGDVLHSLADISKARRILGYAPRYALEDGLKETIEWFEGEHGR
ncbi:MAG: SDR family oxidoreductase [Candidatus Micrarchaeota archaeon]